MLSEKINGIDRIIWRIGSAVVGVLLAFFTAWIPINMLLNSEVKYFLFESDVKQGGANIESVEDIIDRLNMQVQENMLNISISSVIEFENSESEGLAFIENPNANKFVVKVKLFLTGTGDVLYESGGIKPGEYIDYITLNQYLPEGEYQGTARFEAYYPDTLEPAGDTAVIVTLRILH